MIEIKQLQTKHYDQLVTLLNEVFSASNKREMDFEKMLPAFFVRDEKHIGAHYGIFDGERLVAAMGNYPLQASVDGTPMLFTTLGNVVTHPDYAGKGYMSALCQFASEQNAKNGVVASALGGNRHRYKRFGYEPCGFSYTFGLNTVDRTHAFANFGQGVSFERLLATDTQAIEQVYEIYKQNALWIDRKAGRGAQGVFDVLSAWNSTPYIARKDGEIIGYLTIGSNEQEPTEVFAKTVDEYFHLLCAWQMRIDKPVVFKVPPYNYEIVQICLQKCSHVGMHNTGSFAVYDWAKLTQVLLHLKSKYCTLIHGKMNIGIEAYGTLSIVVDKDGVCAKKTDEVADFSLDKLSAIRFVFGCAPAFYVQNASPLATSWFPLPLALHYLDRG